jgi:hypothetical protein
MTGADFLARLRLTLGLRSATGSSSIRGRDDDPRAVRWGTGEGLDARPFGSRL